MRIAGLQKLSFIDYPGRIAAVVFTQGCNFRCPFCHNPDLIAAIGSSEIPADDVFEYLEAHRDMLEGVCVTGGEPTMQSDLKAFIERIKALGFFVKLDTNGTNPAAVRELAAAHLIDYVAMDLKNSWERYQLIANTPNAQALENCKETFALLEDSGVDHEFRTTVLPGVHREEDFFAMAGYVKPGGKYFVQQIRYGKTLNPDLKAGDEINVPALVEKLHAAYPTISIGAR